MPPTSSHKPASIPQADLERQLASLEITLAPDSPGKARARLRDVCEWAAEHCADITIDVLNAVPGGSAGVPIFKVVLAVAMLDARVATAACDGLRERLFDIYEQYYELRQLKAEPVDEKMKELFDSFLKDIPKWRKILSKDRSLDLVNDLSTRIKALQQSFDMSVLRRIAVDTRQAKPSPPRILHKLEGLPLNFHLIGREDDLERVFDLLTKPTAKSLTSHVAIVGLGGIGKTSLATKIAHDPRSTAFGSPVFMRCERVDTLEAFQLSLLRLRAPQSLQHGEELEHAVRVELSKKPLFLILDNLLDSTDDSHSPYLQFINSITSIPNLTLLITSRNHTLISLPSPRPINDIQLEGLSVDAAEELFRNEYARVECDRVLQQNEADMKRLLKLLDGVPLAIVLVAAHARKAQSLADVIRRWKDRRAWDNGAHGRLSSVETSLALSFDDKSLEEADAINLLYILADLPRPVPRRVASAPVRLAMDAALRCSLVHTSFGAGLNSADQSTSTAQSCASWVSTTW
ncbi:hypothetical protein RQP46_007562 [Phenoliferia psychrophenolica]